MLNVYNVKNSRVPGPNLQESNINSESLLSIYYVTSHIHVGYVDELSYIFLKSTYHTHTTTEVLASDSFITDCLDKIWLCKKKIDFYFFQRVIVITAQREKKSATINGRKFSSVSHMSHILWAGLCNFGIET